MAFKKKSIYKKSHHPKLGLTKCENMDGSTSYRLSTKDGVLLHDTSFYPTNFEDVISIHPDHEEIFKELNRPKTLRSVLGKNLDKEMNRIQHSFLTLAEEVLVRI